MAARKILIGVLAAAVASAPFSAAFAQAGLKDYEAASFKGKGKDKDKDKGGEASNEPESAPELTPCAMSDIGQTSGVCYGWDDGNFNSGNGGDKAYSATVLNTLLGVDTFTGPTLDWVENFAVSGNQVNFATTLYGETIVSFHVGAANGQSNGVGYQSTAWYVFDAGTIGIDVLSFNVAGLSNARLYSTGGPPCLTCNPVPEPSSWALLILGFGFVGAIVRRHRWALA